MKTMRQLTTRSLRMLKVVGGLGNRVPFAEDSQDAMDAAEAMFTGLIANGVFGPETVVLVDDDYTAGENERVLNTSETEVDITFPATLEDTSSGFTVTRAPYDRSFGIVAGAEPRFVLYDADLADWVDLSGLTLDSTAPLTGRFYDHLSAILAEHISIGYGEEPPPALLRLAQTGRAALRLKKPIRVGTENAVLRGIAQRRFC